MPRVKLDYVVSFSSEDLEHPASNLLAWEVSKKKWLCKKGESSCSVVLQLTKAIKISAVHIGAYHSALVEVLVARSEKASEQYQVLVPSCVFVPLAESRRDVPVERVRSFTSDQLTSDVRNQRWDRVRVVCSQPYNKHCKYGLSFIHIDEPGDAPVAPQLVPAAVPQRMLAFDTFSSDEDDFRPGELFANHLRNSDSQGSTSDTGAQIRQASSLALKNIYIDSCTKLMKTAISKPKHKQENNPLSEGRSDRSRDTLMYTQDEDKPHAKIDHIVQRHKDQMEKEEKAKPQPKKEKLNESLYKAKEELTPKRRMSRSPTASDQSSSKRRNKGVQSDHKTDDRKRQQQSKETEQAFPVSSEPHTLLKDVVLVLSGYENPQRGNVRNTALAMGARIERDWGPRCTHLICAFPNTPKLRQVRAAGGSSVPIVLADWIIQCSQRRQRLPWQWFATEPKYREREPPATKVAPKRSPAEQRTPPRDRTSPARVGTPPPRSRTPPTRNSDTECDTDDEIEKVHQKQKANQQTVLDDTTDLSPQPDQRQESMEMEGPSTDEDEREDAAVPRFGGALPDFFDGSTFVIDADDDDASKLSRYVTAYGGLVIQSSQLDEDSSVDYVISARAHSSSAPSIGRRVTPAWLAKCHRAGALLPPD